MLQVFVLEWINIEWWLFASDKYNQTNYDGKWRRRSDRTANCTMFCSFFCGKISPAFWKHLPGFSLVQIKLIKPIKIYWPDLNHVRCSACFVFPLFRLFYYFFWIFEFNFFLVLSWKKTKHLHFVPMFRSFMFSMFILFCACVSRCRGHFSDEWSPFCWPQKKFVWYWFCSFIFSI